jgi:hypothetical protein
MPGKQVISQQTVNNKTRYVTIVFNYEDCTKNSYDTVNNFLQHIISSADSYNEHKPYSGSARYNIEEIFTSIDKPKFQKNNESNAECL